MARTAKHDAIHALVDVKQGLVSRELFVNEDLYQQEQEQLFAHCWLFVGHESQIPKPGDYFVSGMGEESIHARQQGGHRAALPLQLPDGPRAGLWKLRQPGGAHR